MRRLVALAVALLIGLSAAPAQARDITEHPLPGVSPASYVYGDALMRAAAADADEWWVRVSGQRPEALDLYVYNADDDASAYGESYSGRVWVTREIRDWWWREYDNRSLSLFERRSALVDMWSVMAHERGHNLGLEHTGPKCDNIMCPTASVAPYAAIAWARQMLPTPKRRHHRLTRSAPAR